MNQILEGTWDEIKTHEAELRGRHLTVIIATNADTQPSEASRSREEWSRLWRAWSDQHVTDGVLLSDEAVSRDSIYDRPWLMSLRFKKFLPARK